MFTGWCPLAADWGNVAELLSALAAIAVGIGAWVIAARTQRLVRSANATTEKLAEIEAQRDKNDEALRQNERGLLLVGIAVQFGQCEIVLDRLSKFLAPDDGFDSLLDSEENRKLIVQDLSEAASEAQLSETTRSRLHNLEFAVAARIVRFEATMPLLRGLFATVRRTSPEVDVKEFAGINVAINDALAECKDLRKLGLKAAHESGMPMPRAKPGDANGD